MRRATQSVLALVVVLLSLQSQFTQPSQHTLTPRRATVHPLTIPLDVTSYGGILLQTRINNSEPMWFYLDSGASSPFVINANKATALGLKLDKPVSRGGGAGPNSYQASQASGLTISLSGVTFEDQTAAVISLGLVEEQFGRPVDGLVGLDLFLKYVVQIDYSAKELTLHDPQSYVYSGPGESVSLTLRDGHIFMPARIAMRDRGELSGQFVVDTGGCMISVVLTTPFARENKLPGPTQKTILDRSISGLGGETRLLVSRATHFKIGNSVFTAPLIYVSQDKGGALASSDFDGLVGTEILRKFKLIFDYPRRRLILERNAHFDEPLEYDMSGMSVRAYGDDFRIFKIYQVLEHSPAAKAGLQVGDIIERIDTMPATRLTLEQILQLMKVKGREYELTIKRGSDTRVVKIKTSRLI